MKFLFFMRSTVYVRNFESTLRLLAERGHEVHVVAHPHEADLIGRISRECPTVRHSNGLTIPVSRWSLFGVELRRAIDYLRYLEREYADAPKLRSRAERNAPSFVLSALQRPLVPSRTGRWLLGRLLHWCDRAVPTDPAIDAFVRAENPDLVLVTPLVEPGSPQADYLRSARALGIRTGLCVYSWDNLTNKGLIHDPLDVVTVWNDAMKNEAVALHGVPANRVVVTGAPAYDHWFGWRPRDSRAVFCTRVGLPADRPYLLYLCSSKFIAPDEVAFVRRWVTELRAAPALRDVAVLVRPHPQNTRQWETADLQGLAHVAVWPRTGANPVDDDSRAEYYDSIYHSAAVVGLNTSAQIESAIVGRGVYTVLTPEFCETQEGTLHFRHLQDVHGGLLHVARSFAEHRAQLEAAVHAAADGDDRCRRFIEAFVRPFGIDQAAAPRLVAAIEATAARGRRRGDRGPWWAPLVRRLLAQAAEHVAQTARAGGSQEARQERIRQKRRADTIARRAERVAAKQAAEAERALRKRQEEARRDAERRAREAVAAQAYENFRHVREWAQRMRDQNSVPAASLTEGEQQQLSALAPLWHGGPELIADLRRWSEPVSGARVSDYECQSSDLQRRLKRQAGFLRKQAGAELFVHEPAELGGFGFSDQGKLYNEDTVRFFNVLVALQDAAVLPECRNGTQRRIVWEIGGGWGGFAYQFKTVCPNVTYLITSTPDLFLLSAVYLMTLFPAARCRFFGTSPADDLWQDWEHVDFVFVPEGALASVLPPRVDLTLDLMALGTMGARACTHVQRAFDVGSRFFYSLLPHTATRERSCAVKTIERLYWPHPVPPRVDPKLVDAVGEQADPPASTHLVGWRRIRV